MNADCALRAEREMNEDGGLRVDPVRCVTAAAKAGGSGVGGARPLLAAAVSPLHVGSWADPAGRKVSLLRDLLCVQPLISGSLPCRDLT